jgi:hypothetical protein
MAPHIQRIDELSDSWFTVERIDDATYAISEYGHWEQAHAYLAIGDERSALIDSGLGIGDIGAVVRRISTTPIITLTNAKPRRRARRAW